MIDDLSPFPELTSWLGDPPPLDEAALGRLYKPLPCLLCGGKEALRCVFFPDDQARVAAPSGKTRGVRYSLCARCYRRPDHQQRAEARIFAGCAGAARIN